MFYRFDGKPLSAAYAFNGTKIWDMLQEHTRQYILHGAAQVRPPNTMRLFEYGYEQGYRFVEADIYITSDGIPVLSHDPTINARARNDDGTALEETVPIEDTTYAELLRYDFGLSLTTKYPGTRITTLSELLDFCREHEMLFMADVKPMARTDALSIIYNMVASHGMLGRTVWCMPTTAALSELTGMNPDLMIEVEGNVSSGMTWKNKTRAVFIGSSSYSTVFTAEMAAQAHAQGFYLNAWTVNEQVAADALWANGCDFITTDVLLNSSVPE
jgi:glycerophosphoryl diester phosphodiesterase